MEESHNKDHITKWSYKYGYNFIESNGQMNINFFSLLTVLFIGLKLTGHIEWSWWAVLSPMWVPIVLLVAISILMKDKK